MSTIKYLLGLKLLFLFDIAFDIAGLSLVHLSWNVIFKIQLYLFVFIPLCEDSLCCVFVVVVCASVYHMC